MEDRKPPYSSRVARHIKAAVVGIAAGAVSYTIAVALAYVFAAQWIKRHSVRLSRTNLRYSNIVDKMKEIDPNRRVWTVYVGAHTIVFFRPTSIDFFYYAHIHINPAGVMCFERGLAEYRAIAGIKPSSLLPDVYIYKRPYADEEKALADLKNFADQKSVCFTEDKRDALKDLGQKLNIKFGHMKSKVLGVAKAVVAWRAVCEQVLPAEAIVWKRLAQFSTAAGASGTLAGVLGYLAASK